MLSAPLLDASLATGLHLSMALQMSLRQSVRGWVLLTHQAQTARSQTAKLLVVAKHAARQPAAQQGTIQMPTTRWSTVLALTRHR